MPDRELNDLFLRYRARGDARALVEVFDRTSRDLLRVARMLARDRTEADDLVQSTWLTAIERRDRFDAARPLRPWLVGILARHAANAARKAMRSRVEESLDPADCRDPLRIVADREIRRELSDAVASLPQMYREVLEPRLRSGADPREIAAQLGRRPATVRMQITRALRMLRRKLPAGVLGALFWLTHRPGLAAVRRKVLERGIDAGPASGSTAAATFSPIGWMLMFNKTTLAILVLGVAIATLIGLDADAPDRPSAAASADGGAAAPPPIEAPEAVRAAMEVAEGPSSEDETASREPASYRRFLVGLKGRLLEQNGEPVAHTRVALLELNRSDLIGSLASPSGGLSPPRVVAGRTTTDDEGRFEVRGAHAGAAHALGIDLGGPRAAVRVVAHALAPAELWDLGDVILDPVVAITGRVVDEEGLPIEGARVRAAALPVPVQIFGGEHLRADSWLILKDGRRNAVIPIPAWAQELFDLLPIPADRTGADGVFHITGAPTGMLTILADHEDHVSKAHGPVPSGRPFSTRDVGTIPLSSGQTLRGRVRFSGGEPAPSIPVVAGPVSQIDAVVAARVARTDEGGYFEIPHLPEFMPLRVAARAVAFDPWTIADTDEQEIQITLPGRAIARVRVQDASGEPVEKATVLVQPRSAIDRWFEVLVYGWSEQTADPEEDRPGVFRVGPLVPGEYTAIAFAEGRVPEHARFHATGDEVEEPVATLTLRRAREVRVRVVAGDPPTPVEYAVVSEVRSGTSEVALCQARTDSEGVAALTTAPVGQPLVLRIDHPGFPTAHARLKPDAWRDEDPVTIRLPEAGRLLGRLDAGGLAFDEPHLILVTPLDRELDIDELPYVSSSDARGDFSIPNLAPGRYRLEVARHVFARDPLRLSLDRLEDLDTLARAEFGIAAGETTHLMVPFFAPGMATACTIEGIVRVDGVPAKAQVSLLQDRHQRADTGPDGRFRFTDVAPGAASLSVRVGGSLFASGSSLGRELQLAPGETREVELDLESHRVEVRVVTADGEPLDDGISVLVRGCDPDTKDAQASVYARHGSGEVVLPRTGRYVAEAQDIRSGRASREFTAPRDEPVVLELEEGTPCAGVFVPVEGLIQPEGGAYSITLLFSDDGFETVRMHMLAQPADRLDFRFFGLEPGTYRIQLRQDGRESEPVEFELPAGGRDDLRLHLGFAG